MFHIAKHLKRQSDVEHVHAFTAIEPFEYGALLRGLRAPPEDVALHYEALVDELDKVDGLGSHSRLSGSRIFLEGVCKIDGYDVEGICHEEAVAIAVDRDLVSGWHVVIWFEDWEAVVKKRAREVTGIRWSAIEAEVYGGGGRIWQSAAKRFGNTDKALVLTSSALFLAPQAHLLASPGIAGCSIDPELCGRLVGYAFGKRLVADGVIQACRFWKSMPSFFPGKLASEILREKGFAAMCRTWHHRDPAVFDAFCLAAAISPENLEGLFATVQEFLEVAGVLDPWQPPAQQVLRLVHALIKQGDLSPANKLRALIDNTHFDLATWKEAAELLREYPESGAREMAEEMLAIIEAS